MSDKAGGIYIEIEARMGRLEADLRLVEERLRSTDNLGKRASDSLSKMATVLQGSAIVAGIYNIGKAALTAAANMEQNRIAFTTMLGSATKANQLLKEMTDFAAATPFELPEVVQAGKSLLAFGIQANKIIPTLQKLGDLSAGVGIPVQDMATIFGKAAVAGRVMNDDLRQMSERGIPIISKLAKVLKTSEGNVRNLAEKGLIGFKDLETAIDNLTKAGSKFGGLMDAQSKSIAGQWSNFKDNIGKAAVVLGDEMTPAASEWLKLGQNIVQMYIDQNKESDKQPGILSEIISKYLTIINPLTMISSAWTDIAGWINRALGRADDFNKTVENATGAAAEKRRWAARHADAAAFIEENKKITAQNAEQKKKWEGMVKEAEKLSQTISEQYVDSLGDANDKVDLQLQKIAELAVQVEKQERQGTKTHEQALKEQKILNEMYDTVEQQRFSKVLDEKAEKYQQFASGMTQLSGQLSEVFSLYASNQTAEVDNELTKQKTAIEERYATEVDAIKNSTMTAAEKNKALSALDKEKTREETAADEEAAKKKRKIARDAAKIQKEISMFETIVNTPTAAFMAWKAAQVLPYPFDMIVGATNAAFATALGAAKVKLIADQSLPALADGAIIPAIPGGRIVKMAEAGSDEAAIPLNEKGVDVLSRAFAKYGAGSNAQTINLILNVDGDTFGSWIYKSTKNGQTLIASRAVV